MALIDKLSAIGNAIRTKGGTTELLTLDEMPAAINGLPSGGGVEIPEWTITGEALEEFDKDGKIDPIMPLLEGKVTTENITNAQDMINCSKIEKVPFDINFRVVDGKNSTSQVFNKAEELKELPNVTGTLANCYSFVGNCLLIREIPESWANADWSYVNKATRYSDGRLQHFFNNCHSLRTIPEALLKKMYNSCGNNSSANGAMFQNCWALDEVVGFRGPNAASTSTYNMFAYTFDYSSRLKRLVFDMENGNPRVENWQGQIVDLCRYVGYSHLPVNLTIYNSGITEDKLVTDDASYQALKNDPDWYTGDIAYSRYNHDSAVETINSLPDCSASGGANTIKFKGDSGSKTDGGAINTMTEEEIAVATAKGWTVSLA